MQGAPLADNLGAAAVCACMQSQAVPLLLLSEHHSDLLAVSMTEGGLEIMTS